jgi:hypothetical protein
VKNPNTRSPTATKAECVRRREIIRRVGVDKKLPLAELSPRGAMPPRTKAAFEQWVARVLPQLLRSAIALLKDRDEAENVVQTTLLTIWTGNLGEVEVSQLDGYARRAVWVNALRLESEAFNPSTSLRGPVSRWRPIPVGAGARPARSSAHPAGGHPPAFLRRLVLTATGKTGVSFALACASLVTACVAVMFGHAAPDSWFDGPAPADRVH